MPIWEQALCKTNSCC
uniref:Uncharacterized protein n=1 Tax=Anguilla anguilla TaxID=7936 RepID=A0A0E9VSC5_ANGAN